MFHRRFTSIPCKFGKLGYLNTPWQFTLHDVFRYGRCVIWTSKSSIKVVISHYSFYHGSKIIFCCQIISPDSMDNCVRMFVSPYHNYSGLLSRDSLLVSLRCFDLSSHFDPWVLSHWIWPWWGFYISNLSDNWIFFLVG